MSRKFMTKSIVNYLLLLFLIGFILTACESATKRSFSFYRKTQEWNKAISYLQNQARLHPNDPDIPFYLGQAYLQTDDYPRARQAFQRSKQISPRHTKEIQNLIEATYRASIKKARARSGQAKISFFQKAVDIAPEKPEAHLMYGTALLQEGKFKLAIPPLEKAAERLPKNWIAQNNLSEAYFRTNDFYQAQKYAEKVINQNDTCTAAHKRMGLIYLRDHKTDLALYHLNRALKLHFDNALATKFINTAIPANKFKEAEPYLVRLAKAPNARQQTLEAVVYLLFLQKKYGDAIPWLKKLRSIAPHNPVYLENLAIAYAWIGDQSKRDQILQELRKEKGTNK